jgi:hypothetical protein
MIIRPPTRFCAVNMAQHDSGASQFILLQWPTQTLGNQGFDVSELQKSPER